MTRTGGGRFSRVDMADDDHVDMRLLFTALTPPLDRYSGYFQHSPIFGQMEADEAREERRICVPHGGGSF